MKSKFLKIGLFLALGLSIAVFYSCDKDDDGNDGNPSKITATNVINSSSVIAVVKAEIHWETEDWSTGDYDEGQDVVAEAQYKNNGFTLELPASVAAKYLGLITELFDEDDDWDSFTISDRQAKAISELELNAYDNKDNEIGYFYLGEEKLSDDNGAMWIYVDRNVTIEAENRWDYYDEEGIDKCDLEFKKGWNVVYTKDIESYNSSTGRTVYNWTLTTKKPSGSVYRWYFDDYGDWKSSKVTAKSVIKEKSFFSKTKGRYGTVKEKSVRN